MIEGILLSNKSQSQACQPHHGQAKQEIPCLTVSESSDNLLILQITEGKTPFHSLYSLSLITSFIFSLGEVRRINN
jgi:hypothetical protein